MHVIRKTYPEDEGQKPLSLIISFEPTKHITPFKRAREIIKSQF